MSSDTKLEGDIQVRCARQNPNNKQAKRITN